MLVLSDLSGYKLPTQAPKAKNEDETSEKKVQYITDDDVWPTWPEGEWLPEDWRVCYRQLPGRPHKCYVPPRQDGSAKRFEPKA